MSYTGNKPRTIAKERNEKLGLNLSLLQMSINALIRISGTVLSVLHIQTLDLFTENAGKIVRRINFIRCQDKILRHTVRPFAGAAGPWYLLVRDNGAAVCWQFLENEGTDTIDWPPHLSDLNLIQHLWNIMFRSIRCHHVASQTVHELGEALVRIWEEIPQDMNSLNLINSL